jgi:hypothetical protein
MRKVQLVVDCRFYFTKFMVAFELGLIANINQ